MPERTATRPGLYTLDESGPVNLHGRRCRRCGFVFFPPHPFGCEACGAEPEDIQSVELSGAGTLHSLATVHLHPGGSIDTPFTVAEIVLDDGPTVRALLVDGAGATIGDRMRATLSRVPSAGEGHDSVELRFERDTEGGGADTARGDD